MIAVNNYHVYVKEKPGNKGKKHIPKNDFTVCSSVFFEIMLLD